MASLSRFAIAGLGRSALSRDLIGTARQLAAAAVRDALADCGLAAQDLDGLLINQSSIAAAGTLPLQLIDDIGLEDLHLLSIVECKGASVLAMVQQAGLAVAAGMASCVACVFADTPVGGGQRGSDTFSNEAPLTGIEGWEGQYGLRGPVASYALAAQRYLHDNALAADALGHHALACRRWAALNPSAFLRDPLTLEDYRSSRPIAEPLRLLDCAYPVNGAAAIIVTTAERAADLRRPPVHVHGMGQGHATLKRLAGPAGENATAGVLAAARAYAMAGASPADVTQCQLYDAFSICALLALEGYGFCGEGEAAGFIADGHTSPGGRLPVNTGGGHLAEGYLQGMTPLAEAVVQARGDAGERQRRADLILVNGSGGRLEFHAALLLSPHRSLA